MAGAFWVLATPSVTARATVCTSSSVVRVHRAGGSVGDFCRCYGLGGGDGDGGGGCGRLGGRGGSPPPPNIGGLVAGGVNAGRRILLSGLGR